MPPSRASKTIFSNDRFSFWLAGALFLSSIIVIILGSFFCWNPDLLGALAGALIAGSATLFGTAIAARQTRLAENEKQQKAKAELEDLRERLRTMIIVNVCVICEHFLRSKQIMDAVLPPPSDAMVPIPNMFVVELHETPLLMMVGDQITLLESDELRQLTKFLFENSLVRSDLIRKVTEPGQNRWNNVAYARERVSDLLYQAANLIEVMRPDTQLENRRGQMERAVDLLRHVAGSHSEPQQQQ